MSYTVQSMRYKKFIRLNIKVNLVSIYKFKNYLHNVIKQLGIFDFWFVDNYLIFTSDMK